MTQEINRNFDNIGNVTRQTADNTRHITATSEELSSLAQGLQSVVHQFKVA